MWRSRFSCQKNRQHPSHIPRRHLQTGAGQRTAHGFPTVMSDAPAWGRSLTCGSLDHASGNPVVEQHLRIWRPSPHGPRAPRPRSRRRSPMAGIPISRFILTTCETPSVSPIVDWRPCLTYNAIRVQFYEFQPYISSCAVVPAMQVRSLNPWKRRPGRSRDKGIS